MKPRTLEKLVWVLMYGGIGLATLGYFVARTEETAGLVMQVAGALAVVAGVVMIWLRSRLPGD